jgi:hypothetical protein
MSDSIRTPISILATLAFITLVGYGCVSATQLEPVVTQPKTLSAEADKATEVHTDAPESTRVVPKDWIRYDRTVAGGIGMSFLYPSALTPVPWDTTAWGTDSVGVDFGGFGVARLSNPNHGSISAWLKDHYPQSLFSLTAPDRDNPFSIVIPEEACEAYVVMDDFERGSDMSGIGGTLFVNVGDAALYTFTLAQDWNQTLGEREEVVRTIFSTTEWFAERTSCPREQTFQDDELRIAFTYPSSWGAILAQSEMGWGQDEGITPGTLPTCLADRAFSSSSTEVSNLFLSVNDTWSCNIMGRGGYWGDQTRGFSNMEDVERWCKTKDSCESFVNNNGVTIWHAYTKEFESWGETIRNVDEYATINTQRMNYGILFSTERFQQDNIDITNDDLRAVVDTLKLLQ